MTLLHFIAFFKWSCIINGGLLFYVAVMLIVFPRFVYLMHRRWFKVSEEAFNLASYCFLGLFKLAFLVFNLTPYLALRIVGG